MEFLGIGDYVPSLIAKGIRITASIFWANGDKLGGYDIFFVIITKGVVYITLSKAIGR